MRKSKVLAVTLAAAMVLSAATAQAGTTSAPHPSATSSGTPAWFWAVFGCAGGIVFTAMIANWQQKRQLTAAEAATCGILFWFTVPKPR
jgi:hypothetical protein